MAIDDKRMSELAPAGTLDGSELIEVVRSGSNLRSTTGATRAASIGRSMASAYTASIANPVSGMAWKIQRMMRPISPFAPLLETFRDDCVQDCGFYTRNGNVGTWSFANGQLSVASTANSFGNGQNIYSNEHFEFPGFAVAVEGITQTTDTGANSISAGIARGGSNSNAYYAFFEVGSGTQTRVTLAKIIGGSFTALAQMGVGSLPAGTNGIALTLDYNFLIAWIQVNGNAWYPVLSATVNDFNFVSASELAQWTPWWSVTGGTTVPWKVTRFRTGYTNSTTFRDFKLVTQKDGTPYISNGYLYFTATNSAVSVWRLNVKTGDLQKTGVLLFNRGGTLFVDLNASIVWDQDVNLWRVVFASWSAGLNAGVQLYIGTYSGDLLRGVHTVTGTLAAVTQRTGNAVYDEQLVWDSANSRWLLSYVVSPGGAFGGNFYPVLDTSTDLVTWTNLWASSATTGYEGSALCKIGGNWYVFAGNGSNFRCWNLAGTNLGTVTVDVFPAVGGNPPPHFIPFPWMDGDTTQYYALSWSNVQFAVGGSGIGIFGTGTPVLYKASQTEVGFELPSIGIT